MSSSCSVPMMRMCGVKYGLPSPPNANLERLKTPALFQLPKTSSKLCSSSLTVSSCNSCSTTHLCTQFLGLPIWVALPPTHVSLQQKWPFTANLWAHLVLEEQVMEKDKRLKKAAIGDMEPTSGQRNDQFQQTAALKYGFLG